MPQAFLKSGTTIYIAINHFSFAYIFACPLSRLRLQYCISQYPFATDIVLGPYNTSDYPLILLVEPSYYIVVPM